MFYHYSYVLALIFNLSCGKLETDYVIIFASVMSSIL